MMDLVLGEDQVGAWVHRPSPSRKPREVESNSDPTALSLLQLEAIARKHCVQERDLGELITFVFAEVVGFTVSAPMDLTTHRSRRLCRECNLTQSEVGDGFSLAAAKMGNS